VLTEYLRHYNTARPHRALGQLAPAQAHPGRRRSTSPSTGSAENKSSADSHTNTRPPHDRPTLLRKTQVTPDRYSSPTGYGKRFGWRRIGTELAFTDRQAPIGQASESNLEELPSPHSNTSKNSHVCTTV